MYNISNAQDSKFNVGLGMGLGLYAGKTNELNPPKDTSAIDFAAGITQIHFEYNVINRIGIGVKFERNGFLNAKDSSDKASSINISLTGRFNIVNSESNLLYIEMCTGSSHFSYTNKDITTVDKVISNGINFQVGAG